MFGTGKLKFHPQAPLLDSQHFPARESFRRVGGKIGVEHDLAAVAKCLGTICFRLFPCPDFRGKRLAEVTSIVVSQSLMPYR